MGGSEPTGAADGPAVGQLSCSMASTLIRHVRATLGDDAVAEILRLAQTPYDAAYLDDVSNWIWFDEAMALFEAAADVTGDPSIGWRVGEQTVRQHAGTPVATLLRSLGSPEAVYGQLSQAVSKFSTVTDLTPDEVGPGAAIVSARPRPGFTRARHHCDWTRGMLSQPPALFGLPPAEVEETECAARGAEACVYRIAWDADGAAAAADPQELVTRLETQMVAMSDRLQNMYATARDLIALDDLDVALARITDRAATAARAPKYLLAVRTGADDRLHVHHRGFSGEDPEAAARELLEGSEEPSQGARIVAQVASATRHYGSLMAASPTGGFFPHERELLDVYARFAASVLDTATAFDAARRRDEQSRALLELSRAIAVASTREEVAQRLADNVPTVVDCDRVVAFLWDDQEEALTCRAASGFTGAPDELIRTVRIRPSDTERLRQILANPGAGPSFYGRDTDDEFIAGMMGRTGSIALVVVPIAAHDRFYGVLIASVTDRPERLAETPELRELVAGVVGQAATALENARLIETMAHQARFDNLTGLLGHRAFHEALDIQLERGCGSFTLAAIDIDDFKLVNDLHGHPVGDEALRRVAEALRRSVRKEDAVFRVGGEEFAIVMPGATSESAADLADRIREQVARAAFVLPLRVSVGVASWPGDAHDRDTLIERADAALYTAKHGGKNRVVIASAADDGTRPAEGAGRSDLLGVLRSKDAHTVAHCAHVAALAVEVGAQLGLDSDRLADLRVAGGLHDVGKVAVPDAILNKPGPLDDDEMRIVRTHSVVGAQLVEAAGYAEVARFVLEHHERVDGSGYPDGLSGDEISLEGRILHAVDAYAAMTSDRPYRRALAMEAALEEVRRGSGTQFDPEVARALEEVVRARHESPSWDVATVLRAAPDRPALDR